jgi:glutathione peroxidase
MQRIQGFIAVAMLMLACIAYAGKEGAKVLEGKVVKDIEGKEVNLAEKYKGQVLLVVNVASKCGMTPQYEQLVELDKKYRDQGLRILGFPANDFMKQEPGTEAEIKEFCSSKYNVEFDMFSEISVKGDDIAPLFKDLTDKEKTGELGGEIKWNFTKFLIGRDGEVITRVEPKTRPDDPELVKAIETALSKK